MHPSERTLTMTKVVLDRYLLGNSKLIPILSVTLTTKERRAMGLKSSLKRRHQLAKYRSREDIGEDQPKNLISRYLMWLFRGMLKGTDCNMQKVFLKQGRTTAVYHVSVSLGKPTLPDVR